MPDLYEFYGILEELSELAEEYEERPSFKDWPMELKTGNVSFSFHRR